MRFGLAIGLLALAASPAQSPTTPAEKVAWLAKNAIPLRMVIDPRDEDFSDLRRLAETIGDARVVMLGGTNAAGTIYAKERLVRFLHQKMGFDVLAAATSFYEAEDVELDWERRRKPDAEALSLTESVFRGPPVIVQPVRPAPEPDPLPDERHDRLPPPGPPRGLYRPNPPAEPGMVQYLLATHQSQRPLQLAGTETLRLFGSPGSEHKHFIDKLFAAIDRAAPHVATAADRKTIGSLLGFVQLRPDAPSWQQPEAEWDATERILNRLIDALGRVPKDSSDAREAALFQYTLIRLRYDSMRSARPPRPVKPEPPLDTLVWIARIWQPYSKIVVWSRNDVIGRNTAIAKELGAKVYSIAFDNIEHESEVPVVFEAGPTPSLRPVGNDFESLLHAVDKPVLFVDFRNLPEGHWLRAPIASNILYSSVTRTPDRTLITKPMTMAWPERYDGLINIDATTSAG